MIVSLDDEHRPLENMPPPPQTAWVLQPVLDHLALHYAEPVNLAQLAALARLSVSRFAALFREHMGLAPYQYLCRLRVQRAQLLLQSGMCGTEVAIAVGFFDQSHLSRHFKRLCRITPGEFQRRIRADQARPQAPARPAPLRLTAGSGEHRRTEAGRERGPALRTSAEPRDMPLKRMCA